MAKPGDDDDDYKTFLSVLEAPQDRDSHLGDRKHFEMGGPVKMTSIASGSMDLRDARVSLSVDDFNELREQQRGMQEQQRGMQERIESLEEERKQRPGSGGEATGLLATSPQDPSEDKENPLTESQIESTDDDYKMPESMYTLLTTEDVLSIPFVSAIVTGGLSLTCLSLALKNMYDKAEEPGNFFGLPAGVTRLVRAAQYLGVIIGVINLEEIPQALELIGKWAEQEPTSARYFSMPRVVLPALLKMGIGYTFLCCLFLAVVQNSAVLDIFYDVLALQFVEQFDDIVYGVCQRGFFGRTLSVATKKDPPTIETSKGNHTFSRGINFFIRFMYIFNIVVIVGLLTYVTTNQRYGEYRCRSVSVSFGDAVWEEAIVDGDNKLRLLIYSHFNGIYKEAGPQDMYDGKPKYIEQNKEDGSEFKETKPAEIVYCEAIESWVFRHDDIITLQNECNWLLRSPVTESYDLVELAEEVEWFVWTGLIESDYRVAIECLECDEESDCNYNGKCNATENTCDCKHDHFGELCQFKKPCEVIRSEKDSEAQLTLLPDPDDNEVDFVESYGRPIYVMTNLMGKPYSVMRLGYADDDASHFNVTHAAVGDNFDDDDFFEENNKTTGFQEVLKDYTFQLIYTGRRWYGKIVRPDRANIAEAEYHAFWKDAFSGLGQQDNSTLLVSAPTVEGSPVGVDFYEMRRRNKAFEGGEKDYDYSPYGVLIPLIEHGGSGFFHCNKDD